MTEWNDGAENRANGQELEKLYQSPVITAIFTHCQLRNAQTASDDTFNPFRYLIPGASAVFFVPYRNYHITCTIIHTVWAHWCDEHGVASQPTGFEYTHTHTLAKFTKWTHTWIERSTDCTATDNLWHASRMVKKIPITYGWSLTVISMPFQQCIQ